MTFDRYDFDKVYDRRNTNSLKWNNQIKDAIPMSLADMDFKCPQEILRELHNLISHGILGYPDIDISYLETVSSWFNSYHRMNITVDNIIPVTGVISSLRVIVEEFTSEGDFIIVQPPVYYLFLDLIRESNRKALFNPLYHDDSGTYKIDFEQLNSLKELKPKLFILCSPHNPVGRIWSQHELEKIGEFCIENEILLVVDEIFCDLIMPGYSFTSYGALPEKFLSNTIVLNSPTKTFNIAGLRGGNVLVFNDDLKKYLNKRFNWNGLSRLNIFYLTAAKAAYSYCYYWLQALISYIEKNYKYVLNYVNQEIPGLIISPLEATYLLWINYKKLNIPAGSFIQRLSENIVISEGDNFGYNGNGFFRINIACPFTVLERAMDILLKAIIK